MKNEQENVHLSMLGFVCSFIRDKRKWTAVPLTTDLNPSKDFPSLLTTFAFQAP
jgi:hypothetical protein